jgi:hypothetical protein
MKHLAIVSGPYTSKVSIDCGRGPIASLTEIFVGVIQAGLLAEGQRPALRPVFLKPHEISVRRRNPGVVGKRWAVPAIDGGPRAIARCLVTTGEGHLCDTETFKRTPIPWGEIRTDEDGRLLVKQRRDPYECLKTHFAAARGGPPFQCLVGPETPKSVLRCSPSSFPGDRHAARE